MLVSTAEEIEGCFEEDEIVEISHDSEGYGIETPTISFDIAPQSLNAIFSANPTRELFEALEYLNPEINFSKRYVYDPCDPDEDSCPRHCRGHRCGTRIDDTLDLTAKLYGVELTPAGQLVATYTIS